MFRGITFSLSNFGSVDNDKAYERCLEVCNRINDDILNDKFNCTNNGELSLKYKVENVSKFIKKIFIETETIPDEIVEIKDINYKLILIENLKIRLIEKFAAPDSTLLNILLNYKDNLDNELEIKNFINYLKVNRSNATILRFLNTLKVLDKRFKIIKVDVGVKPIGKIYSKEQIESILNWFKTNKYYNYYYEFVCFLILTGCRVGEAIGLRYQDVDLKEKKVYIYESLARNRNNSYNRIRKSTKNKKLRVLPINNQLYDLFSPLFKNNISGEKELIFKGINGNCIDDHAFSQRAYKTCIKELKLFGTPNTLRHSFISHLLKETQDIVYVATLTHNSRSGIKTIIDNYAHLIDNNKIPEFFKLD